MARMDYVNFGWRSLRIWDHLKNYIGISIRISVVQARARHGLRDREELGPQSQYPSIRCRH